MSLILGGLGERLRNYLNGRQSLTNVAVIPTVQPVVNVERIVNDHFIRRRTVSITGNGSFAVTTILKDKDVVLPSFSSTLSTGTYTVSGHSLVDDEGNTIVLPVTSQGLRSNVCPLRIDAGWQLFVTITSHSGNGNLFFDAEYDMYPAKSDQGVP